MLYFIVILLMSDARQLELQLVCCSTMNPCQGKARKVLYKLLAVLSCLYERGTFHVGITRFPTNITTWMVDVCHLFRSEYSGYICIFAVGLFYIIIMCQLCCGIILFKQEQKSTKCVCISSLVLPVLRSCISYYSHFESCTEREIFFTAYRSRAHVTVA